MNKYTTRHNKTTEKEGRKERKQRRRYNQGALTEITSQDKQDKRQAIRQQRIQRKQIPDNHKSCTTMPHASPPPQSGCNLSRTPATSTRARRLAKRLLRRAPGVRPSTAEALRVESCRSTSGGPGHGPCCAPLSGRPRLFAILLGCQGGGAARQHGLVEMATSLLDEPLSGNAFGNAAD